MVTPIIRHNTIRPEDPNNQVISVEVIINNDKTIPLRIDFKKNMTNEEIEKFLKSDKTIAKVQQMSNLHLALSSPSYERKKKEVAITSHLDGETRAFVKYTEEIKKKSDGSTKHAANTEKEVNIDKYYHELEEKLKIAPKDDILKEKITRINTYLESIKTAKNVANVEFTMGGTKATDDKKAEPKKDPKTVKFEDETEKLKTNKTDKKEKEKVKDDPAVELASKNKEFINGLTSWGVVVNTKKEAEKALRESDNDNDSVLFNEVKDGEETYFVMFNTDQSYPLDNSCDFEKQLAQIKIAQTKKMEELNKSNQKIVNELVNEQGPDMVHTTVHSAVNKLNETQIPYVLYKETENGKESTSIILNDMTHTSTKLDNTKDFKNQIINIVETNQTKIDAHRDTLIAELTKKMQEMEKINKDFIEGSKTFTLANILQAEEWLDENNVRYALIKNGDVYSIVLNNKLKTILELNKESSYQNQKDIFAQEHKESIEDHRKELNNIKENRDLIIKLGGKCVKDLSEDDKKSILKKGDYRFLVNNEMTYFIAYRGPKKAKDTIRSIPLGKVSEHNFLDEIRNIKQMSKRAKEKLEADLGQKIEIP